jgi:hypothetical protein
MSDRSVATSTVSSPHATTSAAATAANLAAKVAIATAPEIKVADRVHRAADKAAATANPRGTSGLLLPSQERHDHRPDVY